MKKGKQLIGMPVVTGDSRQEIEHIRGFVLDPSETHVSALLVDCDDSSRHARIILLHDVRSFGRSSISVSSMRAINDVKQIPQSNGYKNRIAEFDRTRLITGDGTAVGTVNDIVFNEFSGRIDSFECLNESNEWSFDETDPINLYEELDENVITHAVEVSQLDGDIPTASTHVSSDVTKNTESAIGEITSIQPIGIQNAGDVLKLQSVRQWNWITRIGSRHAKRLWKRVKDSMHVLNQKMLEAIENRRIQRARGRISQSSLCDSNDVKVVSEGEIITSTTIERARRAGMLKDLLECMNSTCGSAISNRKPENFTGLLDDWWPSASLKKFSSQKREEL